MLNQVPLGLGAESGVELIIVSQSSEMFESFVLMTLGQPTLGLPYL